MPATTDRLCNTRQHWSSEIDTRHTSAKLWTFLSWQTSLEREHLTFISFVHRASCSHFSNTMKLNALRTCFIHLGAIHFARGGAPNLRGGEEVRVAVPDDNNLKQHQLTTGNFRHQQLVTSDADGKSILSKYLSGVEGGNSCSTIVCWDERTGMGFECCEGYKCKPKSASRWDCVALGDEPEQLVSNEAV